MPRSSMVVVEEPDGSRAEVRPTKAGTEWSATFRETTDAGRLQNRCHRDMNPLPKGAASAYSARPKRGSWCRIRIWSSIGRRPSRALMAQLAEMTKPAGGAALAAEELPDLLKRLAEKPPELKEEVVAKVTYWDTWPFFLMFVGLLGTEWFLRKRWGLV